MNASERITSYIHGMSGWRAKTLTQLRKLIRGADAGLVEEWKWNTPVWTLGGNVVAVGAFKDHVKVNFFKGAALADPKGLFNAGLESQASRAIDIHEGDRINEPALQELVRAAVALDRAKPATSASNKSTRRSMRKEAREERQ